MFNNQKLIIHQLLHGYDEGHRLLNGSIKPDSQSAKNLVAFSDLSGQGTAPGTEGYITGYPLPLMNSYALARTWLAPEMPRPGCVWTHTLLIEFSDLATLGNVDILEHFVRPSGPKDVHSYSRTLTVEIDLESCVHAQLPSSRVLPTLEALYEYPMHCIFVQLQDDVPADHFAMAIWLQQWPRLQRNFRFCTWASSDRSRSGEPFDLQFIPGKRGIRSKSKSGHEVFWVRDQDSIPATSKDWALAAAKDIGSRYDYSLLRKFLLRYGAETDSGRAAFKPLVKAWQALESDHEIDVVSAIGAAKEINPPIISLLARILQEAVKHTNIFDLPKPTFEFVLQNLTLIDEGLRETDLINLASKLLLYAPDRIRQIFRADSPIERSLARAVANLMQPDQAIEASAGDADLLCVIIEANPELAASSSVWNAQAPIPMQVTDVLKTHNVQDLRILSAMLGAENPEVPKFGIQLFGQTAVNTAVEYYDSDEKRIAHGWIIEAGKHPELLSTAVAHVNIQKLHTLALIASIADYRAPSLSENTDDWVRALSNAKGDPGHLAFDFYAFLLARALSGVSPETGMLIHFSFDVVHNNLLRSRSTSRGWAILNPLLPEIPWNTWDKAKRVRLAVANTFVNRSLPPKEFLEITDDDYVFKQLAEVAAESSTGRSFLHQAMSLAKQSSNFKIKRKSDKIKDVLYPPKWSWW